MKIDELIECNMTNIFLEKSNIKSGGDPFLKAIIDDISESIG